MLAPPICWVDADWPHCFVGVWLWWEFWQNWVGYYLIYKLNYQILKASDSHDVCGMIESNSSGFVFDFAGSDTSKLNDLFSLIQDLKGHLLISTKDRGSVETPRSTTVVVFARCRRKSCYEGANSTNAWWRHKGQIRWTKLFMQFAQNEWLHGFKTLIRCIVQTYSAGVGAIRW